MISVIPKIRRETQPARLNTWSHGMAARPGGPPIRPSHGYHFIRAAGGKSFLRFLAMVQWRPRAFSQRSLCPHFLSSGCALVPLTSSSLPTCLQKPVEPSS